MMIIIMMMISSIVIASVILAAVSSSVLALPAIQKEKPYLQDISHRSTFKGQASIAKWDVLPFDGAKLVNNKNSMVHVTTSGSSCDYFITVGSDNTLYSASRNLNQNKIGLENPYNAWEKLFSFDSGQNVQKIFTNDANSDIDGNKFSFFLLTNDNIVGVVLSANAANVSSSTSHKKGGISCSVSVKSTEAILKAPVSWQAVSSVTSSSTYIWLSDQTQTSSTSPDSNPVPKLFQINIESGEVSDMKPYDSSLITSLYWIDSWAKLFIGSSTTIMTYSYDSRNNIVAQYHEWIGAIVDTAPQDMSYDKVNDALWVAETNAIHKLSAEGLWFRFGAKVGSPVKEITAVRAVNGYIWAGSKYGLLRIKGDVDPAAKQVGAYDCDANANTHGGNHHEDVADKDPWTWMYYAGHRYLPDNLIGSIVAGGSKGEDKNSIVMVVTATGMSTMEGSMWLLSEKARAIETFQNPRHNREGLTSEVSLEVYGDVDSYKQCCSDNDGLWTSMSAMGQAYRYMSTGEEEARLEAWDMFVALENLFRYPGAYPHFPARSFARVEDANLSGCGGDVWFTSPVDSNYIWKSTTSSDETDGHLAALPLIYDHIAKTEEEKSRVYKLIEGLTGGILANDLYLIDPSTGQPTKWGFWNPSLVNDDPDHYSERGANSLGMLAYCASAYSVTGDSKYKEKFWELGIQHNYIINTLNCKIDDPYEDNHSDNELLMMTFHILFYSLQRLPDDGSNSQKRAEVKKMVDSLVPAIRRVWTIIGAEKNPLWTGVVAGTAGQLDFVKPSAVSDAAWSLRHLQIDMINWQVDNSNRWDITLYPYYARDSTNPLMREIRPPQERGISKFNSDPFVLLAGDGYGEEVPHVFTLPFYLMRYNNLI